MTPKVIFLTTDISVKGGTPRVMADLATGLSRDFDLSIIVTEGQQTAYPYPESVELFFLGAHSGVKKSKASRTINSLRLIPAIAKQIEARKAEIVVSFLTRANIANVCARGLSRSRYRGVLCEQNFNSIQYAGSFLGRSLQRLMRLTYPQADVVVPNAADLAADLHRSFGVPWSKLRVIHNPMPLARIAEMSREELDHAELAWFADSGPVVVNVGRLIEQKNQKLLLEAFSDVRRQIPCRLVILGDGPLAASLLEYARSLGVDRDIALWGWRDNPFKYMAHAAAFALTSSFEGSPNVLMEAMACGCPIISTDCPSGPGEILNHGELGLLVPMGDRAALARQLLALLKDVGRRQQLSSAAHQHIQAFDTPLIVEKYKTLIMELAN